MNETLQREPVLATIVGEVSSAPSEYVAPNAGPPPLEERIHALEVTVDQLKNSPEFEERITTRILERLPQAPAAPRWYKRLNPFRGASLPMPSGWVFVDLFNEIRLVLAMLFDRRYGLTWTSRGILVAALAIAFTTSVWLAPFGLIPIVGAFVQMVLEKILILLCGGLVFKILHREAKRYRTFLESLM